MAVVAGGDQAVQSHIVNILQYLDGVYAAWILAPDPHVGRIVLALRACRARRREGPVIGVLNPSIAGIEQSDGLFDRLRSPPFGRGVAAVHRMRVIELGIALGNEVSMKIGNRP